MPLTPALLKGRLWTCYHVFTVFLFQDVFTVSVGNLPPQAQVLIKITYITELSVQGSVAAFFLPATVAPWRRDKALNENTQVRVLQTRPEEAVFSCDLCVGKEESPKNPVFWA